MKLLEERILTEGIAENENVIRVDGFLNHQVDPVLMEAVAKDFAEHFKNQGITKVVTIESSGIAPALLTAKELGVELIIMKKQPSKVLYKDLYQTVVASFTKDTSYELTMSKSFLDENDHVLIIDDFLAYGEAVAGAIRLVRMAHATIAGVGILIEKTFQEGRQKVKECGSNVYSQVKIKKLSPGKIELEED